jgi:hypothetical protein
LPKSTDLITFTTVAEYIPGTCEGHEDRSLDEAKKNAAKAVWVAQGSKGVFQYGTYEDPRDKPAPVYTYGAAGSPTPQPSVDSYGENFSTPRLGGQA